MSQEFRTLRPSLEQKNRTDAETHLLSQRLEIFMDLMLIAAVKGQM